MLVTSISQVLVEGEWFLAHKSYFVVVAFHKVFRQQILPRCCSSIWVVLRIELLHAFLLVLAQYLVAIDLVYHILSALLTVGGNYIKLLSWALFTYLTFSWGFGVLGFWEILQRANLLSNLMWLACQ